MVLQGSEKFEVAHDPLAADMQRLLRLIEGCCQTLRLMEAGEAGAEMAPEWGPAGSFDEIARQVAMACDKAMWIGEALERIDRKVFAREVRSQMGTLQMEMAGEIKEAIAREAAMACRP